MLVRKYKNGQWHQLSDQEAYVASPWLWGPGAKVFKTVCGRSPAKWGAYMWPETNDEHINPNNPMHCAKCAAIMKSREQRHTCSLCEDPLTKRDRQLFRRLPIARRIALVTEPEDIACAGCMVEFLILREL